MRSNHHVISTYTYTQSLIEGYCNFKTYDLIIIKYTLQLKEQNIIEKGRHKRAFVFENNPIT